MSSGSEQGKEFSKDWQSCHCFEVHHAKDVITMLYFPHDHVESNGQQNEDTPVPGTSEHVSFGAGEAVPAWGDYKLWNEEIILNWKWESFKFHSRISG